MAEKKTIIEINGLEIKEDSIYKIIHKPDADAPDGLVREGASKIPSLGVSNLVGCRYIMRPNSDEGLYDTGFYKDSPCYAGMTTKAINEKLRLLNKYIVEPYESLYSKGILEHLNTEFWDKYRVSLSEGRYLVTSNPADLLDLYISVLSFDLTPKNELGNPKFRLSQYCVEDKELVQNIRTERNNEIMDAITSFGALEKTNKSKLDAVLKYIGVINHANDVDEKTKKSLTFTWLQDSEQNPKLFNSVVDLANNKETQNIVDYYVMVAKLNQTGVIKREGGYYFFNSKKIGGTLKDVAKNLNNKGFEQVRTELIDIFEK